MQSPRTQENRLTALDKACEDITNSRRSKVRQPRILDVGPFNTDLVLVSSCNLTGSFILQPTEEHMVDQVSVVWVKTS